MALSRTMVLIHGAWQGSWAFADWRAVLHARGWQTHAIDLPGNGWPPAPAAEATLETYTAAVLALLAGIEGPVVLVGHSGGGITASQVAEAVPGRIAALVFLAGMMLPPAMGFADIIRLCQDEEPGRPFDGIAPYLERSTDGHHTAVTRAGALQIFLHDCEPSAAARAADLLRPQQESGRLMKPSLSAARYGSVPRIYVECSGDRSVLLPLQRKMQELSPGATRIALDCGHVPQLAVPLILAEHLEACLAALPS